MYAPLLANRYLTSRIIPFIAVAAVALCVALVIIVVSVMTGFLDMVRNSGRTLIGDVVVNYPISGIPYYEELISDIEALPEAAAASPIVETLGLLRMPYGTIERTGAGAAQSGGQEVVRGRIEFVEVWGIDPASLDRVAGYYERLYWTNPSPEAAAKMAADYPRLDPFYHRDEEGRTLRSRRGADGIVLVIEVSEFNHRTKDGSYRTAGRRIDRQDREYFMGGRGLTLTLLPISSSAKLGEEQAREFDVVNEFQSGVYQIDSQRILAPISAVQDMLQLGEAELSDPRQRDELGRPKVIGTYPARATTIVVRAADGVSADRLRDAVELAYLRFAARVAADPTRTLIPPDTASVETWEGRLRNLIGPVEKERELMRTLFSIVYLVCAALVLAIFWAIVQEKTRDIGILRAVGASRTGVLWIFLRYGVLIGVVGSALGVLLAWGVVARINDIHDFLGTPATPAVQAIAWVATAAAAALSIRGMLRNSALHTVFWLFAAIGLGVLATLLLLHKGIVVWDPSIYYFTRIPSEVDRFTALTTALGGVVFSVIGAAIPAARAADTDPVQSLRYE